MYDIFTYVYIRISIWRKAKLRPRGARYPMGLTGKMARASREALGAFLALQFCLYLDLYICKAIYHPSALHPPPPRFTAFSPGYCRDLSCNLLTAEDVYAEFRGCWECASGPQQGWVGPSRLEWPSQLEVALSSSFHCFWPSFVGVRFIEELLFRRFLIARWTGVFHTDYSNCYVFQAGACAQAVAALRGGSDVNRCYKFIYL